MAGVTRWSCWSDVLEAWLSQLSVWGEGRYWRYVCPRPDAPLRIQIKSTHWPTPPADPTGRPLWPTLAGRTGQGGAVPAGWAVGGPVAPLPPPWLDLKPMRGRGYDVQRHRCWGPLVLVHCK